MLENRKGYVMASNTKSKKARGRQEHRLTKKQKRIRRRRKLIGILAAELVLLLVLGAGVWAISKLDKIQDLNVAPSDVAMNDMEDATEEVLEGYTNIALFGIDTREMGDLGAGNRSDTIIIASINNETKEVKLASVFRDTYLNRADDTYGKCNAAYKAGGPNQAMAMLNTNFDLNIKYFVSVDFLALIKTIDLLGGIDVDVQENEWEWINNYMYETTAVTGEYGAFVEGPGLQTLGGLQATAYCRIRAVGNDYGRTERQRTVISLIAQKAKTASLGTINQIIDEVFPLIATNIPKTEMIKMAASMMSYEMGETGGFPSLREDVKINKADIVAPADLEANVRELHRFLFNEEDYYPSPTVIRLNEEICNQTGVYAKEESGT
ncbi:MAG: LCP family protein [Lachnospiraceae bacterium]|jgi:LCP family protein required for cell wall assembly|nr:LCP family protein [Lachnospiraceae bacterium]MCI9304861.1 LCP family protein [Lachnospiraceae bacterium]